MDSSGEKQIIGGIETYLLNLALLCEELGWSPILFQSSINYFQTQLGPLRIIGVPVAKKTQDQQRILLFRAATNEIDINKDLIIFGADHYSVPIKHPRCIAIQHGISWDLPTKYFTKKKWCESGLGAILKKKIMIHQSVKFFENCQNRVCVDYNFYNWYRTICATEFTGKIWVIPNFASVIANETQLSSRTRDANDIAIIFARRFTPYRGARIMADAASDLLARFNNVKFTFAGEGPDEDFLKRKFADECRVTFIKYLPSEVLDIHLQHDIAVVPSIASEGTSLSVAEAMGAGCAVLATPVGGISNMIIDGFNGKFVMPDKDSLTAGMEKLILNPHLREVIGKNAHATAREGFSLGKWKSQWKTVLEEVAGV